jgi:hypothetical protein
VHILTEFLKGSDLPFVSPDRLLSNMNNLNKWIFFLFATASRPALGSTLLPIQWVPGALNPGIKWPGREADYSLLSSDGIKNVWSCTSPPPIRIHGVVLK